MTPLQVRDAVSAAIGNLLGEYTQPNGVKIPALRVGNPPSDWGVTGIECVILPTPELTANRTFGGGDGVTQTWRLELTNRDATKSVESVVRELLKAFPDSAAEGFIPFTTETFESVTVLAEVRGAL